MMNSLTTSTAYYDANELLQNTEAWASSCSNFVMDGTIADFSASGAMQVGTDALTFVGQSPSLSLTVIR